MKRALLFGSLVVATLASAGADGGVKKSKVKAPDFEIPSFGAIPKGDDLTRPEEKALPDGPSVTDTNPTYSLVKVQHSPSEPIALSGNPLTSERFSTVVRVKCPERVSAPLDVLILDPRGDTAMSATGRLTFRGTKGDETDYAIDWDPTPFRSGGDYQVMVKVAGQVVGTTPLKFVEKK